MQAKKIKRSIEVAKAKVIQATQAATVIKLIKAAIIKLAIAIAAIFALTAKKRK